MTAALVDIFCRSFPSPPAAITLDIDDTCDPGSRPSATLAVPCPLRHAVIPAGPRLSHRLRQAGGGPSAPAQNAVRVEVRILLNHLTRRIRRDWPRTRLTLRGDSHNGRTEAMTWCEENGIDFIFGLASNAALHGPAYEAAGNVRVRRAEAGVDRVRGFAEFDYAARSWHGKRRVVARLEATTRGFDARYIVTSLEGEPRRL